MPLILAQMLAAVTVLSSCASTATRLPEISEPDLLAESLLQQSQALESQTAHRLRLAEVGHRVLLANADLCPKTRRNIGVLIHSEDSYPTEMRIAAQRELGVTATPTIFHVIADSPADQAGILPGDVILMDGEAISAGDEALEALLESTQVDLSIRRGEDVKQVTVEPDTICHSRLRLRSSAGINAIANGRNITVTSGMMEFTQSD
ncbi:MAG: M48 family metallopeptidase, partial [Pseudomonadota bacterium]